MARSWDHPNIFVADLEAQRNVERKLPTYAVRNQIDCVCIHHLASLCSREDGDWIATSKYLSTLAYVLPELVRRTLLGPCPLSGVKRTLSHTSTVMLARHMGICRSVGSWPRTVAVPI